MKIKNIIWDWNGTVVDDAWVFVDIMNSVLKREGLPLTSLREYKKNFCFPIQKYWQNLGFKFNQKEFIVLNRDFIEKYQSKLFFPKLHVGMLDLLFSIKKQAVRQFVLSASEQNLLNKSIEHYNVKGVFCDVFGVDNLNAVGKVERGRFLLKKYHLKAKETLLIGDTEYDWEVAQNLGCRIILISHGHINHKRLQKTGCLVLKNVDELNKYLLINL